MEFNKRITKERNYYRKAKIKVKKKKKKRGK